VTKQQTVRKSHVTLGLHFRPQLLERVRRLAAASGLSFNRWVMVALEDQADLQEALARDLEDGSREIVPASHREDNEPAASRIASYSRRAA
jgi:hypothetical protein